MLRKVLALLLAMSMLAGMVILPAYADEAASQENALETAAEPSETVAPEQTPETVPAVTEAETPAATIEETVPAVEATVEQLPAATVAEGGTSVTLTDDRYPSATKIAAGETATYTYTDFTAASGDMLLFSFDVRCESVCSAFTIQLDFSGTDTTMKYYAPIQWSRVYMPVSCSGSLNCVKVTADTGAVLIGATALENKGNATIDDLKLQSGMWMLDDFQDVALDADYGVRNENQDVYTALGVTSSNCVDLVISSCGNYVYSIGNGALTVTDVSDPSDPKVRSIYKNPDYPVNFGATRQIALLPNMGENGDAVIFTGRISGAFIVDVSNPDAPVECAHYDAQEMATGITSYENYAFIANRQYGVEVVDVTDLKNPVHLGVVARGGEVQSCKVVDGILYCGIYDKSKVEMYDVTDVVNAKLLGTANLDGHGDGLTVATVDGRTYLYAGTGHHSKTGITHDTLNNLNYGNGNGLEIFDVTDPANPVLLSVSKNDGRFCHSMCDYWGAEVAVKDGRVYVYLLNTYNGVHIYDATNPAAPVRLAHVTVRVDKDSPYYNSSNLTHVTSLYPYIFSYDPNEYKQAPVGAMTVYEGALYLAGVYTDLHIYETELAHPLVVDEDPVPVVPDTPYFNDDLVAVRPGGQTAAIVNYKDYMYVAAGIQGVLIYSKDLKTLYKTIPVEDVCYDLYIQNGLLYTAEGRNGAAVYTIGSDGLTLTETKRYVSDVGLATTIRPSATGKFIALSVSTTTGEIVDISATPRKVASCSTGTQAYHHYVQTIANGRYVVFWGLSGLEQWYDFGPNDSFATPKKLFSSTFRSRAAMAGGYTAYKDNMVIMTRSNGYVYYDPTTLTGAQIEDLALNHLIRPVNAYGSATATSIYGRGIVHENLLISCDRVYGRIYITDITDIDKPVLIKSWTGVKGTPDIATVVDDTLYIPMGYEGIMMEDLTPYITGHTHCDCGAAAAGGIGGHTCNDAQKWTKWTSKTTLPTTAGYYYLSEDVTLTATNWQTNQQDIHICLNGHTVTGPTDNFLIFIRGELTVTDCKPVGQQGQMIAQADIAGSVFYLDDYDGGSTAVDSELTIYGGTYRNSLESVTKSGGLLFMGNKTLGGTTTFNMYGGMFIGAKTTTNGGSINAFRKPTINLYGGTITGGSADKGGAIYILTGTLNIKGGNITDNTATANGGAVCFYDSTVNVSGGTITGNSAVSGGVIYTSGGTVNVTGGTIVGNSATEGGAFYGVSSTKGKPVNFNIEGGTFYTAKNENYDNPATTNTAQHGGHIAVVGLKDVSIVSVKKGADLSYGYTTGDEKGRCGGNIFAYDGVVNIHDGGLVSYGRAYLGGNIYIGGTTGYQSICTMSGGSVTEGVATCASYSGDFYPQGGNLFIAGGEKFVLKGGAISNGFASHAGGNICMDASGNMEMSDGTVSGGLASYGGNIALNNSTGVRLTVGGGEIIGGSLDRTTAKNGTGHCIRVNANSNVVLKGQPVIDEIFFGSITGTKLDATQMESLKRPIHICVVNNTKDFAFATVDEDLSGSFLLTARSYYAPNEYYVIPAGHAHYIEADCTLTVSRHARTSGSCMELVEAKAATCTEAGHEAYYDCLDCTYTTNITPIAKLAHTEAEAVKENVTPADCYAPETWESVVYCSVCKAELSRETQEGEGVAHPEIIHVEEQEATCTAMGNIEYWYCADCGQAWLDEACTLNTNMMAVKLPVGDHKYEDGKCVYCGEADPNAPVYKVILKSYDVSLEGEVKMLFKVEIPAGLVGSGAYARMTVADRSEDFSVDEIYASDLDGSDYVELGVPAMYMTKPVTIQFFNADGSVMPVYSSKGVEFASYTKSVADVIRVNLGKNPDAKTKEVLIGLATYGGYAQTFFKSSFPLVDAEPVYNLLAEYGLSKADVSGITQATVDNYLFNKGESNGLTLKSADAELQAAINMIMLFEMDAQYSVGDFSAVAISPTGARTEVKIEYNNHYSKYAIVVDDIPAMYWDNDYRVEITNNVTGVTNTVSGSVMAVVRLVMRNQNNPQAVKELVAAMYVYGKAATVKFGR